MISYVIPLAGSILNIVLGVIIFAALPRGLFPILIEGGLIHYSLMSLGYFGVFGKLLSADLDFAFFQLLKHRFVASIIPLTITFYFSYFGSLSLSAGIMMLICILFWIISPAELYSRRSLTIREEVIVDAVRQLVLAFTKLLVIFYACAETVILTIVTHYIFNYLIIHAYFFKKIGEFWAGRRKIHWRLSLDNSYAYGVAISICVFFLIKGDYFAASGSRHENLVFLSIAHKLEEICLLVLTSFSPWYQRRMMGPEYSRSHIVIFCAGVGLFLSLGFFVVYLFQHFFALEILMKSDSFLILMSQPFTAILFIIAASMNMYGNTVYTEVIMNVNAKRILTLVVTAALAYALILVLAFILVNEVFYLVRFPGILGLAFIYTAIQRNWILKGQPFGSDGKF
jgi:hypothetical protein